MASTKDKHKRAEATSSATLTVEAELLDTGLPAPKPGVLYAISIMRYKVLKVTRGKYPHQFIFVGHKFPDLQSPQFSVGTRHRLRLTRRFPKQVTILNGFENESKETGIYYCLSFEVIT
jgi:hypothetical protein